MSYKRSWTKIKVSISTNDHTKDNSPFLIISTKISRDSKLYKRHVQERYDRNVSCKILCVSLVSRVAQWKRVGPELYKRDVQERYDRNVSCKILCVDLWVMGPARFHCATLLAADESPN